jgi:hypothetical protein
MPDLNDLKLSVEKLAQQAKETAEIGVSFVREQIHAIVPDPELVERLKQVESVIDAQVAEAQAEVKKTLEAMQQSLQTVLKGGAAEEPMAEEPAADAPAAEPTAEEATKA